MIDPEEVPAMTVICFGDSNTWGYDPRSWLGDRYANPWPDHLAKHTGWEVINLGRNGQEIPKKIPPYHCDLLMIMLGTNDLLQGNTPEQVCARMESLLKTISQPVLLIAPPPMQRGEWVPDSSLIENVHRLSKDYAALAARLHIPFCDSASWNLPLCFDGVHFTEEAHLRFAENLALWLNTHK